MQMLFFLLLSWLTSLATAKVEPIYLRSDYTCQGTAEFFDNIGLLCQTCDAASFLEPNAEEVDAYGNAMGCSCNTGYSYVAATDQSQGYTCSATCKDQGRSVASDGTSCASCFDVLDPAGNRNAYDTTDNDCKCTQPGTVDSSSAVISYKLQEMTNYTTSPSAVLKWKDCVQCESGKAVITSDVLTDGRATHLTAGVEYPVDKYTCASCPDDNMFFDSQYACKCGGGLEEAGNTFVGPKYCVDGKMTSDFEVEYAAIQSSVEGAAVDTDSVRSDTLEHYLDWAFYNCDAENFEISSLTQTIQEACQALANMCVMNLYDNDHIACEKYQNVKSERDGNYYDGISGWKEALPWLYYGDAANTIREDREISMSMSFVEMVGYVAEMDFRLGKYTVNGTFVGFEKLSTQFTYCGRSAPDTEYGAGASSSSKFLKFGTSQKLDYTCDLETLESQEMFLYDMWLVQADGVCLYPVPVLMRNLKEDGVTPNMNFDPAEEVDDIFTRRFFLFDNMSGRSSGSLEVLRYAKKVVLTNSIQPEDPSKIFPPTLTIDYVERKPATWTDRAENEVAEGMALDGLTFTAEYTMETDEFWSNVEILVGFVSAIAGVLWLVRVRNWQTRNQRIGSNNPDTGENNGTMYMVHVLMMLIHTFVIVFFPFVFSICAYWFVFFKLQETVFVMMPANNEFYTTGNEYFFYETMFYVLFWCHTVYLFYAIYQQCNADIFFVDWEKPKSTKTDVSIWRTLMVANEWNEMQTQRKTSIEFSLVFISFFLIGLDLQNNATMQPNIDDVADGYINIALRFCNTTWWFFVTFSIQWFWRFLFYERYYREPRSQIFVDLCTMAKISVFIMDEPYHGYYLHCRSPYEFADGSMMQLAEQLKKEESGLTTDRGLDAPGAPRDCQTFELFTSPIFRSQFDKVYTALHQNNSAALAQDTGRLGHMVGRAGGKGRSPPPERMVAALKELNGFLQSFVEQSPPPSREELKRIVREPPFFDQLLGNPPADIRASNAKCVFYPDQKTWLKDHNFLKVTFLGLEPDLWMHNVLTFNLFDMALGNTAVSVLGTYLVHMFLVWVRGSFGQGNLASKTLVDDRFLV
ncbi:hypothetical protein TrST_g3137 [Triparma strigata]|uniref:Meckelin n=1 Tax=Triparma strigata TaxID=1606541 RepID=A0A9W7F1M5_9STRA|nr:hypothetical protein TrST_g3137 [Triparma strigata]